MGGRLPFSVDLVSFVAWQVLDQFATEEYVQQLHAPADGQHRHVAL